MHPIRRKIHAKNRRDRAPSKNSREKFTRKIHATDVSRTRFAWENITLKLQPGPEPPQGGPTAEIHAKNSRENSRDEVPPICTPFLTLIFRSVFGPRGSPLEKFTRKIHATHRAAHTLHFWSLLDCVSSLPWQVFLSSPLESKRIPEPPHCAESAPSLRTLPRKVTLHLA